MTIEPTTYFIRPAVNQLNGGTNANEQLYLASRIIAISANGRIYPQTRTDFREQEKTLPAAMPERANKITPNVSNQGFIEILNS